MDKNQKFLRRLSITQQLEIDTLIDKILSSLIDGLDVKKLKGYTDVYRARSGDVRIIFRRKYNDIEILDIGRRSEKTYRKY